MARKKRICFKAINTKAMESFQDEIEELRVGADSYTDAIVQYCEKSGIEIEEIILVLSASIIEKIKMEEIISKRVIDDSNGFSTNLFE